MGKVIFEQLFAEQSDKIKEMSALASGIVREHYDPIIGVEQNDYMLQKFQTEKAIKEQLDGGYRYFFLTVNGEKVGFIAFYKREEELYLSKFYIKREARGLGYAHETLSFLCEKAREIFAKKIALNVNKHNDGSIAVYEKLGFVRTRAEKNDIGGGFYMDDFVYEYII